MMKKLMLIYYNIVAVLTILYLVLTATLMNLGNAFITTQGWHVVILSILILVIVFGMEFAKKKFPEDFFEFIIESLNMGFIKFNYFINQENDEVFKGI